MSAVVRTDEGRGARKRSRGPRRQPAEGSRGCVAGRVAMLPWAGPGAGTAATPLTNEAVKEIALLKRMVGDQDRRIASLERTVRSLQTTVLAAALPIRTSWSNPQ